MDRERLLKQITILDFMATDLQMYLNTHPQDEEAIKMYNDTVTQSALMCAEYEECYGPMVGCRSKAPKNTWEWQDSPWPWQPEFNFRLTRQEERLLDNPTVTTSSNMQMEETPLLEEVL